MNAAHRRIWLCLLVAGSCAPAAPAGAGTPEPDCGAGALALHVEGGAGTSDGMSHQGAFLDLSNRSDAPCRIPTLPLTGFADADGHAVHATRRPPVGMHPGPAMVPLTLPPGGEARAILRWVSNQGVYVGPTRCASIREVLVLLPGLVLRQKLRGDLCGPASRTLEFDQTPFAARSTTARGGRDG